MAHHDIFKVLLRTSQVLCLILIAVFVVFFMPGVREYLANTTAGVAFDTTAAVAAVSLFTSVVAELMRSAGAPRKPLAVAMFLDDLLIILGFTAGTILAYELG